MPKLSSPTNTSTVDSQSVNEESVPYSIFGTAIDKWPCLVAQCTSIEFRSPPSSSTVALLKQNKPILLLMAAHWKSVVFFFLVVMYITFAGTNSQ